MLVVPHIDISTMCTTTEIAVLIFAVLDVGPYDVAFFVNVRIDCVFIARQYTDARY